MAEPEVIWTSSSSINGWDYRIIGRDDDYWFAKFRLVRVLRLERRRSSFDAWSPIGPGANFLKWPPRTGTFSGKPHTYHSRKTAIAFLQGYAEALR